MNRMTTRLVTPGVTVSSGSEVGRQQRHDERGSTSGHANEAMFMFSTAGIGFLFNMIVIISLLSSKSLRNTSGAFVIHGEALIVCLWYTVRHWSFICDTRWGINRLFVIHGEALIVCDTWWGIDRSFVIIHGDALIVYLWYTVRHWSFICDTRWGIDRLFVIHGDALIVYLWYTVRHWSFVIHGEALIVHLWYTVNHWSFICDTRWGIDRLFSGASILSWVVKANCLPKVHECWGLWHGFDFETIEYT